MLLPHNASRSDVRPEQFERRARLVSAIARTPSISATTRTANELPRYRHENAVAFGLEKPVFQDQYGELDAYATALTILVSNSSSSK